MDCKVGELISDSNSSIFRLFVGNHDVSPPSKFNSVLLKYANLAPLEVPLTTLPVGHTLRVLTVAIHLMRRRPSPSSIDVKEGLPATSPVKRML